MPKVRIFLKRDEKRHPQGPTLAHYETVDVDAPELHAALSRGGFNEDGTYETVEIIGATPAPAQT